MTPEPELENRFGRVLAAAVAARGLTLESLCARLRVAGTPLSMATLSYWQSGRSVPSRVTSLRALPVLERLLELPSGALVHALPSSPERSW